MKLVKLLDNLIESNNFIYTMETCKLISDWLQFGSSYFYNKFSELTKLNVPREFKKVNSSIYRAISLPSLKDHKRMPASWTSDITVAKLFAKTDWFGGNNDNGDEYAFILGIKNPKNQNVILNVDLLLQDINFKEQYKNFAKSDKDLFPYTDLFNLKQKEIIYIASTPEITDIWKLNGGKNWNYSNKNNWRKIK